MNGHDLILSSLDLYVVSDKSRHYRGKLTSSSTSPSFNSVTNSSVMSSPSNTASNTGNISPPRTLWAGTRDGESEAKILAIALSFLRSKVLGGDHGGVLDADFGVPAFFAGVF